LARFQRDLHPVKAKKRTKEQTAAVVALLTAVVFALLALASGLSTLKQLIMMSISHT
jgi:hypothetical protein